MMLPRFKSWYALSASSRLYILETAAVRSKVPVSANLTILGKSCLALAPYEPTIFTCRRTRRFMSTSPRALESARPIITAFPPSRTLWVHCWNVCGLPSASTAMSTPTPPVISLIFSMASSFFEFTV
uniref:Uncharacterized protein n=1 Tax=Opuntia streptacantha TaxID=393608 RepID=A0A7C8YZ42_OPUST